MTWNIFSVVHEFAVLGTTFFILAFATLWYSPLLFGVVWQRVSGAATAVFDEDSKVFYRQLTLAFLSYFVQVLLIAWLLTITPRLGIEPFAVWALLSVFASALLVLPVTYEGKSWQYAAVHGGFAVVSLAVAIASLTYWPW